MTAPADLEALVRQLWKGEFKSAPAAFSSREFLWLVKFCLEQYCGPGTAGEVAPKSSGDAMRDKFDMDLQRHEMERLFRFVGAPWYEGAHPDPEAVAESIHRGYTAESTEMFTMLPLDLVDDIAPISFGSWQICEFTRRDFEEFIGFERLKRVGPGFVPDVERLHQLSWLVLRRAIKPWFQRSATIFNIDWSKFGIVDPFPREFDAEVERGLFVLALYPWEAQLSDKAEPWQPFKVPWAYTTSRHVFGFPPQAPDPDALSWTLAQPDPDEDPFEVPAVLRYIEENEHPILQDFASRWWDLVSRVAPLGGKPLPGFNPRVEHFLLRGFLESKIDQLLWHVTAIDAAVGKGATSVATTLARRIYALTKNKELADGFKNVHYRRRSELIHGKDLSGVPLREADLAEVRRVGRAVTVSLIEFVDTHPGWSRDQLIGFLDS
jgi:hypothetical protein